MKKSRNMGMQTFDQALFDAFEANSISYEDALRNAIECLKVALEQYPGRTH
jgi:Tfp pilus assembly ATPase PilU